jgi:hypothetical protein
MGTFHTRTPSTEPSILVGWAAGLLHPWPEDDGDGYELGRPRHASTAVDVLEALAAADGEDAVDYTQRYLDQVGAVLSLTTHSISAILAAALQVRDELSPAAVLDVLEGRAPRHDAAAADRQSHLVTLLAS